MDSFAEYFFKGGKVILMLVEAIGELTFSLREIWYMRKLSVCYLFYIQVVMHFESVCLSYYVIRWMWFTITHCGLLDLYSVDLVYAS